MAISSRSRISAATRAAGSAPPGGTRRMLTSEPGSVSGSAPRSGISPRPFLGPALLVGQQFGELAEKRKIRWGIADEIALLTLEF